MVRIDDLIRAGIELCIARFRSPPSFGLQASRSGTLSIDSQRMVERIAYVIPRVAARLPWSVDCLIQARAAGRWLASAGIASDLHFGVHKVKQPVFEAHAWLTVGEKIVTGGDISGYIPLERDTLLSDVS